MKTKEKHNHKFYKEYTGTVFYKKEEIIDQFKQSKWMQVLYFPKLIKRLRMRRVIICQYSLAKVFYNLQNLNTRGMYRVTQTNHMYWLQISEWKHLIHYYSKNTIISKHDQHWFILLIYKFSMTRVSFLAIVSILFLVFCGKKVLYD